MNYIMKICIMNYVPQALIIYNSIRSCQKTSRCRHQPSLLILTHAMSGILILYNIIIILCMVSMLITCHKDVKAPSHDSVS